MNKRFFSKIKRAGFVSSPVIIGAIMVLSLFAGQVAGTTYLVGFTDETPIYDNLIGGGTAPMDTISVIGINLWTDTADTLTSIDVEMTDVGLANFNPNVDIQNVWIFYDEPVSVDAVWDPADTQIGVDSGWPGAPPFITTVNTGGFQISVDDSWENTGSDFFVVVQSSNGITDLDDFTVTIPNGGIVTSSGALAFTSYTTATITCDGLAPWLGYPGVDTLAVTSDIPGDPYLDDEDTNNLQFTGNWPPIDVIFFNDYPGEGSDQIATVTVSGYTEDNAWMFYGVNPYFNEDPVTYAPSVPYSGPMSVNYKLTWTEADTDPTFGYNSPTWMQLRLEDRVGYWDQYMWISAFAFYQDDDTPMLIVDLMSGAVDEMWYYDESLSANYLPYADQYNTIRLEVTDQWWLTFTGNAGSGFDRPSSYAQYRVGVERNSVVSYWNTGWVNFNTAVFPIQDFVDIDTQIRTDNTIGWGAPGQPAYPSGYYFIEYETQDDVSNTVRIGNGVPEIVDDNTVVYYDSNRYYFKIASDFSWYHGNNDNINGYTISGTEVFEQAAISVSNLDIPSGQTLILRDTEIFLDSQFDGERHVDVQGTLITDSMSNSAGYDPRSAFTRRGLPSYPGAPFDSQYTFWVRDTGTLDMSNTVVEGCGFSSMDDTLDDFGLYIRTDISNANIVDSEFRENFVGIVAQYDGGATIDNSDIWGNVIGILAHDTPNSLNIWNNNIYGNFQMGILLDGSYADIDNNNINGNGQHGIQMFSGMLGGDMGQQSWADITNNDISNNGIGMGAGINMMNSYFAPETAHSDFRAFYSGTGNNVDRNLTRTFDLSPLNPGDRATLTFWLWYDTGPDSGDGFNVLYWNDTWARWLPLIPVGSYDLANTPGYPNVGVSGLDGQPGFAANNQLSYWTEDGWTQVEYDLTQFSGQAAVELRFRYGSNNQMYGTGVLIDDLAIPELEPYAVPWEWNADSNIGWTLNGWQNRNFANNPFPETMIDNNNITQNADQGILAQYSDVDITNNYIWDNFAHGIVLTPFVEATIDGNTIDDNSDENILMMNWIWADITNNDITNSDGSHGISMDNYCRVVITGNDINWNDGQGIQSTMFCDLVIGNNEISYNNGNGVYLQGIGITFDIYDNSIQHNSGMGIYTVQASGVTRTPYEGSSFYWAQGRSSNFHSYMTYDIDLTTQSTATLTFQHAWMIEPNSEGAFVEYWDQATMSWMTMFPEEGYIQAQIGGDGMGPNGGWYWGWEGYSAGWRQSTFDLDMLVGTNARIRFHYVSDANPNFGGWTIDDIVVTGDGGATVFSDDAEGSTPTVNQGFLKSSGRWNYITDNIIKYNNGDGIFFIITMVDIDGNVVSFNTNTGVFGVTYNYAQITNNEITFNSNYGIWIIDESYIEIIDNNISHNNNHGIYIQSYCQVIIDSNIITYQNSGYGIYAESYVHIEITNNLIAYNHKEAWGYGIYLTDIYSSPVISDNTITENGHGIYLQNTYVSQPPSGSYAWHTKTSTFHSPQVLERSFDLGTLAPGDTVTLTFWQYYDFSGVGGGCVQVFDAPSGSWMTIMPIDSHGYENPNVQRLFNSPGYTTNSRNYEWNVFFETFTGSAPFDGSDDGWIMAEFDLSAYAGSQNVRVRWFANDWVVPSSGWYVDDVTLYGNGAMMWEDDMEGGVGTWSAQGWSIDRAGGVIYRNEISNHLGYGIESYNYVYLDIEENQIIGNGYNGIFMQSEFSNLYDSVRPAAPSGTHMWYSGYSNYADFYLEQTFDLRTRSEVTLTFYHWYYINGPEDGAFVQVFDSGEWVTVNPRGTYPDDMNLGGEGYSSNNYEGQWFYAHFDLSEYAGQFLPIRFRFIADPSGMDTGWYIDDITITGDGTVILYDNVENGNMGWTVGGYNIVDNRYGPPKGWSIQETNSIIIARNDISYNGWQSYAGVYFETNVQVIIDDNDISHNGEEGNWGPGIYGEDTVTVSARNNRIRYNAWGGVWNDNDDLFGVWQDNIITHNYGTETDYTSGHGVYLYQSNTGIFANNYIADNQHAGMYLENGDFVIMGNTITNNHWQGIHMYDTGYNWWNHPTYLEDNIITDNYMFDRVDGYMDDEWSGVGVFLESSCYVHVFNGVYSNNERYGIFATDSVSEFQWIVNGEAEVENNAMRIYSGNSYVEDEFGGGEIYPVLVADGGMLTLKNVRDFQIWLIGDADWYGIEVEAGGTLDARDTTFDSWYEDTVFDWDYYVPNYVWSFFLPFPVIDDDNLDYGQFMDNTLTFTGVVFGTEIPWEQGWTALAGGEYKVNYESGEVQISPFTVDGTGSTAQTYNYDYKRPLPYIFRVFGSLHMDDSKVVNTTSLYIETTESVGVYNSIFTLNFHGGISSVNSNPIIQGSYFNDLDFGIFAEGGTLTIGGSGNRFENCEDAIYISDFATATIEDNTFDNNVRAITVYDSTVTITDNTIMNCADDGLHVVSSTATITGNSISNSVDMAVYLRSTTATMSMNDLNDNYFSVYASDTILSMTSDSIAGTGLEDIYSEDNSQVTALDIDFDREEVLMVADTSRVEIQWYTTVQVLDMTGDAFEGADVDVTQSTPSQQWTDASGLTPQFITTEYIQYAGSQDDRKPHTITAEGNVTGIIYTGTLNVDITESTTHTIVLNLGPTIQELKGNVSFDEDTILRSAFDLDTLFEDDGGDDGMTYWWSGNVKVVITANPDNVVDLTAASNWNGTEVVEFFAMDIWGETVSQQITIKVNPVNDPPEATDVEIAPVSPDDMDDLTGSYVWFDPVEAEDIQQGSIITWYKSTDGGINYGKVEEVDGVLTVPYTATHWGEMWYFTVIPGDNNGGLGDEAASNVVYIVRIIPDITFDDAYITPSDPTKTDELVANLGNPVGDTNDTIYQWYRNGEPIDGATFDTLTSEYYNEGDTITVSATPFDGYNEGDPVMSSAGVIIGNSPPSLESVVIMPQQPTLVDDLLAVPIGYSDPDVGDYTSYLNNTAYYHLYYVFTWRVGGNVIEGVTGDTLDYRYFDVGDVVNVTVTPSDGEAFGVSVTSEDVTIAEAEPESDFDGDGIPDDTDIDDDNDGHPDINDVFPFDEDEWSDFDRDGVGDNEDNDDDNDGFADPWDFAPKDPDVQWQPWIWFVILVLVILLIFLAYLKWWRVPKEPRVEEESSYHDEPEPEEETLVEEPVIEDTEMSEEELRPEKPFEEPAEEEINDETSNDLYKEIDEITKMGVEEGSLNTGTEAVTETEEPPKKKRRKR